MDLRWTARAISDLERLHDFLAPLDSEAAAKAILALTRAPLGLLARPRIGEQLTEFAPREVRRILIGRYEMRYELKGSTLHVLRFWHTREER